MSTKTTLTCYICVISDSVDDVLSVTTCSKAATIAMRKGKLLQLVLSKEILLLRQMDSRKVAIEIRIRSVVDSDFIGHRPAVCSTRHIHKVPWTSAIGRSNTWHSVHTIRPLLFCTPGAADWGKRDCVRKILTLEKTLLPPIPILLLDTCLLYASLVMILTTKILGFQITNHNHNPSNPHECFTLTFLLEYYFLSGRCSLYMPCM